MNNRSDIQVVRVAKVTPGSTGHWPVPSGYQPLGMEKARKLFLTFNSSIGILPIPSGQWPDGTGGSPVLPMETAA